MKTLDVQLPGASYPITIGAGILDAALREVVGRHGKELVLVVTNETLAGLYPGRIEAALQGLPVQVESCVLPDGERYKTLETLAHIFDRLMALEANRQALLIAFGGGVIGDMTGFAAACFMRGVPYIQVPTTLLADVDSSVGGKTAVNHPLGKNAIGAFKQPQAVVMELDFLRSLPPREMRAGTFELIKHGIIRDSTLFDFLEEHRGDLDGMDPVFWEEAVARSCRVKAEVVAQDERETDLRAILNFGHSLAHLIETHAGYGSVLHGEAVGAGMLFAAYVSHRWGGLDSYEYGRIRDLLLPLTQPISMPPLDPDAFAHLLMHDKKAGSGTLKFVALNGLGHAVIRGGTAPAELWPMLQDFLREQPQVLRVATA
jgi:3-dehydroquinate synthase